MPYYSYPHKNKPKRIYAGLRLIEVEIIIGVVLVLSIMGMKPLYAIAVGGCFYAVFYGYGKKAQKNQFKHWLYTWAPRVLPFWNVVGPFTKSPTKQRVSVSVLPTTRDQEKH